MHFDTALTSLRATRISVGLRPMLDGVRGLRAALRVVSVHRAVVNLALGDGRLVAIASEAVGGAECAHEGVVYRVGGVLVIAKQPAAEVVGRVQVQGRQIVRKRAGRAGVHRCAGLRNCM